MISILLLMMLPCRVHADDPSPDVASEGSETGAVQSSVASSWDAPFSSLRHEDDTVVEIPSKYTVAPRSLGFRRLRVHAPRFGTGKRKSFGNAFSETVDFKSVRDSLLYIDVTRPIENITDADVSGNFRDATKLTVRGGLEFDWDGAHFRADSLDADRASGEYKIEGGVEIVREHSRMRADRLFLRRNIEPEPDPEDRIRYRLLPHGHDPYAVSRLGDGTLEAFRLDFTERKRAFRSEYLWYDSAKHAGLLTNVRGYSDPFYFGADSLRVLGPGSFEADGFWITTCDLDDPHYRLRLSNSRVNEGMLNIGTKSKLQLGKKRRTLFVIPKFTGLSFSGADRLRFELDAGSRSELGYYVNFAQWYSVTPNLDLAYRFYPTANEGLGIGIDGEYDFRQNPASHLFGATGEFETLYTTGKRGFTQWYHRQELSKDLTMLAQWEQWYDRDFVKDFYNDEFEDRTGPRMFANLTYLRDGYIVTGTASKSTHDFVSETEKLPEATFHLLERRLGKGFYLTLDSAVGYYNHVPENIHSQRYSQVARLSYDINLMRGLNVLPFLEGSATHYSQNLSTGDSDSLISGLAGVTAQMRFQRSYGGFGHFDGFKHIVVPSVTYFHENSSSMDFEDVPRFDSIDNRPSRERVESKIDNVVLGRNSEDGQVWRVARVALYQGIDLSNEISKTSDYEIDMEIRPRPWWGFRAFGQRHEVSENIASPDKDYDRVLAYVFYDDNNFENSFNARLGYAVTHVDEETVDREILYGIGYKISDKWSVSADHTYDLERDELRRQSYQIRRRMHKWSMGLRIRDRPSGTDVNVVMSLVGFSGTEIGF